MICDKSFLKTEIILYMIEGSVLYKEDTIKNNNLTKPKETNEYNVNLFSCSYNKRHFLRNKKDSSLNLNLIILNSVCIV